MRLNRHFAGWLVAFTAILATPSDVLSCGGTPQPNCFRTIWIAKFVPRTFVLPPSGPILVPVDVLAFVNWNTNVACAQPLSATLTLQFLCTPQTSGAAVDVGVQTFPVPTPTTPGLQPLAAPTYTIPAGVLDRKVNHLCRVIGVYTVTFGAGIGSGPLVATGDTTVCLVEPAPGQPAVPRLDMQLLTPPSTDPFLRCRKGDQGYVHYLVTNNDPKNAVSLTLTSQGRQTAGLPTGFTPGGAAANYDAGVYAISNPITLTDTFPAAFEDGTTAGALLPIPDPAALTDGTITAPLVLPPLGATIIHIKMRSFGMCANGSCNERFLKADGMFSDGTRALGCASHAAVVDNVAAKSALVEVTDVIKVNPQIEALYSPLGVKGPLGTTLPNTGTFFAGDLRPGSGTGMRLTGALAQVTTRYPPQATDLMRIDPPLVSSFFDVFFDLTALPPGQPSFADHVTVTGFVPGTAATMQVPFIAYQTATQGLDIALGAADGTLAISDHQSHQSLFQGTMTSFEAATPQGFFVDPTTCRIITVVGSGAAAKTIYTAPLGLVRTFNSKDAATCLRDTIRVLDARTGLDADWAASVQGTGLTLVGGSGAAPARISIDTELVSLSLVGANNVGWVHVTCPNSLNDEMVPVVTRVSGVKPASKIAKGFKTWKNVAPGGTATGTITITNHGKGPLTFDVHRIAAGPFSLVDASVVGRHTLERGESLAVQITYAPPALGTTDPHKGKHTGALPIQFCSSKALLTNVKLIGTYKAP